jgi:hypothetical protein
MEPCRRQPLSTHFATIFEERHAFCALFFGHSGAPRATAAPGVSRPRTGKMRKEARTIVRASGVPSLHRPVRHTQTTLARWTNTSTGPQKSRDFRNPPSKQASRCPWPTRPRLVRSDRAERVGCGDRFGTRTRRRDTDTDTSSLTRKGPPPAAPCRDRDSCERARSCRRENR